MKLMILEYVLICNSLVSLTRLPQTTMSHLVAKGCQLTSEDVTETACHLWSAVLLL